MFKIVTYFYANDQSGLKHSGLSIHEYLQIFLMTT